MALPVRMKTGKNLCPTDVSAWEQGTIGTTATDKQPSTTRVRTKQYISLVVGKKYTISCATGFEILANPGVNGNTLFGNPITFTAEGTNGIIVIRKSNLSDILPSDILNAKPMLELGAVQTAWDSF